MKKTNGAVVETGAENGRISLQWGWTVLPCDDTQIIIRRVFAMCMDIAKSLVGILPFTWLLEIIVKILFVRLVCEKST